MPSFQSLSLNLIWEFAYLNQVVDCSKWFWTISLICRKGEAIPVLKIVPRDSAGPLEVQSHMGTQEDKVFKAITVIANRIEIATLLQPSRNVFSSSTAATASTRRGCLLPLLIGFTQQLHPVAAFLLLLLMSVCLFVWIAAPASCSLVALVCAF